MHDAMCGGLCGGHYIRCLKEAQIHIKAVAEKHKRWAYAHIYTAIWHFLVMDSFIKSFLNNIIVYCLVTKPTI